MGFTFAAVTAVASLASGVMDIMNQGAIDKAGEAQAEENRLNTIASLRTQGSVIRSRTAQERAQVIEEVQNLTSQALRARGTAAAQVGGGEAAGRTIADIQLDISRSAATVRSRLSTLQEFRETAAEQEINSLLVQAQGRITSGAYVPYRVTSPLAVGVEAVGAGFQGYAIGKELA